MNEILKDLLESHTLGEVYRGAIGDIIRELYLELQRTPEREKFLILKKFLKRVGIRQITDKSDDRGGNH